VERSPEPGWYHTDEGRLRWWNGQRWTGTYSEAPVPEPRTLLPRRRRFLPPLVAAIVLSTVVPPVLLALALAGIGQTARLIAFPVVLLLVVVLLAISAAFFLKDRRLNSSA
jgi:hypothetical protein